MAAPLPASGVYEIEVMPLGGGVPVVYEVALHAPDDAVGFDPAAFAEVWAAGFTMVLVAFLAGKSIGVILSLFKR